MATAARTTRHGIVARNARAPCLCDPFAVNVQDVPARLDADGWRLVWQKVGHRQLQHPRKPGTVTGAGKTGVDIPPGTLRSILKQTDLETGWAQGMKYMVVVEPGPTSVGVRVPDLPGCVAVGETREEALELIREAIELHLEALHEQGKSAPRPSSSSEFVDVAA